MLTRNTDIVRINHGTVIVAAGNQGSAGTDRCEALIFGHHYRIRQDLAVGETLRIAIHVASVTNVTEFRIRIWRKIGTTYYLVDQTANLIGTLVPGQKNTVDHVVTASIREGDTWSWLIVNTAPYQAVLRTDLGVVNAGSFFYSGPGTSPNAFENNAWVNQYVVPIEMSGPAPHGIGIGDSIMSGNIDHVSYADTTVEAVYPGTTKPSQNNELNRPAQSILAYMKRMLNDEFVYQNMGIGGQTSAEIVARYATDVDALKPRLVIYHMGINDNLFGVPLSTLVANYTTCINNDIAAGRVPIVLSMMPGEEYATEARYTYRRDGNSQIKTMVTAAGGKFIDCDPVVGIYRAGGPAGNFDHMNPLYAVVGKSFHLNPAGMFEIAQFIADGLGYSDRSSHVALSGYRRGF